MPKKRRKRMVTRVPSHAEERVLALIVDLKQRKLPLPARAEQPNDAWYGEIERQAGVHPLFLSKPRGAYARAAVDAAARTLGVAVLRPQINRLELTIAAAGGLWTEAVRRHQKELGEYCAAELTAAKTLIALMSKRDPEAGGGSATKAISALRDAISKGKIRGGTSHLDHLDAFEAFTATQVQGLDLPETFCGALEVSMAARGLSAGALAGRIGIRQMRLVNWRSGARVPDATSEVYVSAIERELGLEDGELLKRIQRRRAGRGKIAEGLYPPELRGHHLMRRRSEISPRLRTDVLLLDTAKRHAEMRKINDEIVEEKYERAARNAFRQDTFALKDWPADAAAEFKALSHLKNSFVLPQEMKRYGDRNRLTTLAMRKHHISLFFGYLSSRRDESCRIAVDDLSLTLLMIPPLLRDYMEWKSQRTIDKERLSDTDVDFITMSASLVNSKDGFLMQHPELASRISKLIETCNLRVLRRDGTLWTTVSPANWMDFCRDCYEELKSLEKSLRPIVTARSRIHELLPILELPDPSVVVYRAIDNMRTELRSLERNTLAYARLQRNLVIFHISTQVALRAETWLQITVGGRAADLVYRDGRWQFNIPAAKIKTGDISRRFANNPIYTRELLDDDGLYDDINEYMNHSRSMICGERGSLLFLANCQQNPFFKKDYFQNVIRTAVDKFIGSNADNENMHLMMKSFSIHPFRHILATTILKRTGSYELAGDALADDPETIRKYYSYWCSNDRAKELLAALGRRKEEELP
ncbi:hypothetical protein [Aureimonas phyllosphaerae]|uniref:Phage integrase family protein n=1 Tax=Aureimonas phyllosphaerae TaxID=1166078 RepID=A0A7W6C2H5_9HYPH|nr:hypothetical protein [Aureimonas phyllosphaerae]MBB3938321.1 hypothetical protein [Aureimonas phyllosphaerae]MBB3962328.1 hypothetical protein [Aureimonas phyllosphaerae]SFF59980.1 hypothetical protein SAMN05216566_1455 [Aureimonas phyllosphaerae]